VAPEEHGRWIYYPWSARLVHLLPPDEFRALRCDRNRYKITDAQQARLARARIAIAGLSVGQATAVTLALEGIGGVFHLADFDTLGLSNLNRLRAGIHQLGIDKTIIAARQMLEIDPYLDVRVFERGVDDTTLDEFLSGVDLVVEECDDLYIKLALRERARERRIPVIMETSDRGMLDIERFDREPARPILHGLTAGIAAGDVRGLSTRDKVPTVLRIIDGAAMSTDLAASLPEIDETISSWPQLASAVALGAAVATDTARRILLDQLSVSGRFYVDLSRLVAPDTAHRGTTVPSCDASAPQRPPPKRPAWHAGAPTADDIRFVVAHAALAPSAGNTQPWRFRWTGDRLVASIDDRHAWALLDFERAATHLAFGAAIENLAIAARALGLRADVTAFPLPDAVCEVRFARAGAPRDDGIAHIATRVTNREIGAPRMLDPVASRAFVAAAESAGARVQLVDDRTALDRLGALVGAGDRLQMLGPVMHRELVGELRFDPSQVAATRDGLDVATLALPPPDEAGLRVIARPEVAARLRALGGGAAFERRAHDAFAGASAAALITCSGTDPSAYFAGGRAVQRAWLAATAHGIAIQPHSGLPYLFARLERGDGHGLDPTERVTLWALRERWRAVFDSAPDRAELMLLRLSVDGPPRARSLRRDVDDILTID
jgi:molybdopterin/thiamine biosynthesis adenylyltransferase/nitroreductase